MGIAQDAKSPRQCRLDRARVIGVRRFSVLEQGDGLLWFASSQVHARLGQTIGQFLWKSWRSGKVREFDRNKHPHKHAVGDSGHDEEDAGIENGKPERVPVLAVATTLCAGRDNRAAAEP